jgi:L-asparaginase II
LIDFGMPHHRTRPGAVEVVRGGSVESVHSVHIAVRRADGTAVFDAGQSNSLTFYRSAAKPFQALPLVEAGVVDRFGLTRQELALCAASHEGEPEHVAGARSILKKAGVDESWLRCGAHMPFSPQATARLTSAGDSALPIHNNCSGKHAGMLALAQAMGWSLEDYHLAAHPVQQRMRDEVVRWSGLPATDIPTGVDGCGVVCFAVPLESMAMSFAAFAGAAERGEAAARVVEAMTTHPFMVGGTGRTCTEVMQLAGDRVFVKLGAEGVYGGGIPGRGLGFAIKVADGGRRAVEVALIRLLEGLGVLSADEVAGLARHGNPRVTNTRGEVVGEVRAAFDVAAPSQAGS